MPEIKYEVEKTLYFTEHGDTSVLSEGTETYLRFDGKWIDAAVVALRPKSMFLRSEAGACFVKRYSQLEAVSDKRPVELDV